MDVAVTLQRYIILAYTRVNTHTMASYCTATWRRIRRCSPWMFEEILDDFNVQKRWWSFHCTHRLIQYSLRPLQGSYQRTMENAKTYFALHDSATPIPQQWTYCIDKQVWSLRKQLIQSWVGNCHGWCSRSILSCDNSDCLEPLRQNSITQWVRQYWQEYNFGFNTYSSWYYVAKDWQFTEDI